MSERPHPLADLTAELAAKLRPLLRPAFAPQLRPDDAEGPVSKLAGRPWLPAGTGWPACPNCSRPMQMLLQLDLSSLPEAAPDYGRGLMQLFYCTSAEPNCEDDCESYFPFSKAVVGRLVDPTSPGNTAPVELAASPLPAQAIESWEQFEDVPNWEERAQEVADWTDDEETALDDVSPASGEKLGGWPAWIQGVEYPSCPKCDETMRLVFQIDSEQSLPIMFGDIGCGHLTSCAQHPEVLSFAWACG